MKTLIVEDDFVSRIILQKALSPFGECHIAANGIEAIEAFMFACAEGSQYDLVCLDIMMPGLDGQEVLKRIRAMEVAGKVLPNNEVKVIMTTALMGKSNIFDAFNEQCDAYMVKPIDKDKLIGHLNEFGLI